MSGALAGVRVLDLTRYIPGPYATLVLGDLGADVVKVEEPPFGDPTRAVPPPIGEDGALHAALNRNKRSLLLDLRSDEGAALVRSLARSADVLVESYRPGVLARRGLGAAELTAENGRLVYCSLSGYGQSGPLAERAGHDLNYLARAGLLQPAGDGGPTIAPAQIADMTGGLYAVVGILAALHERARSGRGQVVDVSLLGAALGLMTVPLARVAAGGSSVNELTGTYACYNVYRCRDGRYVSVAALEPKFWEALCRALGHEDKLKRQWEKDPARRRTVDLFAATFASRDRDEWLAALAPADCCVEPVLDPLEALAQAASALVEQTSGDAAFRTVGTPIGLSRTPASVRQPAPRAGEHTDEVLREAGFADDDVTRLRQAGVVA